MGNFTAKLQNFINIFIEKNGYVKVLEGLQNTVYIAVFGLIIGIFIGLMLATVKVSPGYSIASKILKRICNLYVGFFRGTPIVVQLLLGHFVILPLLNIQMAALGVCVLIFGLNSGAYISEIMRGGIQSVDPGQMEAGRAVGLSYWVTMWKIVIPQAVRNILPMIGNEFIALIKETAVVSFVGTQDLYVAFSYIGTNSYEFMVPYLVMAIIYIVLVAIIAALVDVMERRLSTND